MIELNLWSRIANKVYIEILYRENIETFDELFNALYWLHWEEYINTWTSINVQVTTRDSKLTSEPTIQGIVKKAVIKTIAWDEHWKENPKRQLHIEIVLLKNRLQVLIDTSGESLSRRWYRTESGEAPLRENIAAGIVLLSGWKFREALSDPFCGSGTILIEAALIARNIAPNLGRRFQFEHWKWTDKELLIELKKEARSKVFNKHFAIQGYDMDSEVIEKAKRNAERAGVADTISFEVKKIEEARIENTWVITNPPYGIRLKEADIIHLHTELDKIFEQKDVSGGCITPFDLQSISRNKWKLRKLYNGWEKCNFYKKTLD